MAGVVLYRDEAVVLRTHKLSDADRIITLLTRHHGKVRAVGNGVRMLFLKRNGRLLSTRTYRDPRALPLTPHLWASQGELCFADWHHTKCYRK